ncbi:MAG: hypothetical protein JNK94_08975 [Hyphomonadaceae bacterium]|nr:hypothetical protein [Hyphomonadaceae bacterium]
MLRISLVERRWRAYIARPMRKDMSKVIVERPRIGRAAADKRAGRTRVVEDDDGAPVRAGRGARKPVREKPAKTKLLNENLSPLRRYLESQLGRPWDKVFSEISAHLKPTSTVQQHVRDHLTDFVAIATRMKNGVVMVTPRFGGERALAQDSSRFYVHPRTGLLRENPEYKTRSARWRAKQRADDKARAERMRVLDSKTELHKLKGDVWWEVRVGRAGDGREPDVVALAQLSDLPLDQLYSRPGLRAIAKRQLNKADKKKYGLL